MSFVFFHSSCLFYSTNVRISRVLASVRSSVKPHETPQRIRVLQLVDEELKKGNEREALSLVKDLQGKPSGLQCFGAARQIPQRLYTLDELKLNGIDTSFLSPVDNTLGSIEKSLLVTAALGGVSAWLLLDIPQQQVFYVSIGVLFLWTLDLISFNGGMWNLVLDTIGHNINEKYHNRVIQHEAGHFLIAYLLGVLPKGYMLSSLEAFRKEGSLNVQAGTAFVDFEFVEAISKGEVSTKLFLIQMLNEFSCIALAGVATEYLLFGYSEGGLTDIKELDVLLKSLGFTQKKADSVVRFAVLNTVLMLRRHERVRSQLAEAMAAGKSVGERIEVIESRIDSSNV